MIGPNSVVRYAVTCPAFCRPNVILDGPTKGCRYINSAWPLHYRKKHKKVINRDEGHVPLIQIPISVDT